MIRRASLLLWVLVSCTRGIITTAPDGSSDGKSDAGSLDSGARDAGAPDAGGADAGSSDAGLPDAGSLQGMRVLATVKDFVVSDA